RGPVLLLATNSALVWNFFFIPPRFSFHVESFEDAIIFAMFFVVAIAMGHLTSQLRQNEMGERDRQQRTAALYELVHQAALAHDLDSGLHAAINLTERLFGAHTALLLRLPDYTLAAEPHPASSYSLGEEEYKVALWAFGHRTPAGKFTDTFSDSRALHLPLEGSTAAMGVLSIQPLPHVTIEGAEKELLETFAVLIGTILEKDELLQGAKRAEIIEARERLERTLLQSVSHELKTPLSAVQAGMEALRREVSGPRSDAAWLESQQALRRLHRVINNLLNMTRIESGAIHPNLDWCDIADLIQAAIDLAADGVRGHAVVLDCDSGLPLVRVDQALLEQCLCNLLLNAAAHSAPGGKITIRARCTDRQLLLSVLDEGSGISEADLPRIFGAFERGAAATPGGTGLGLAIVEGFVQAHGGKVTATNRASGGAELTIKLPVETLKPDILEKLA
ncbi:MAG TPA: ATP-binding protein, partial [Terriglobales bacterium]|nr:ATP-binding protein [Terriglobales bacterium]